MSCEMVGDMWNVANYSFKFIRSDLSAECLDQKLSEELQRRGKSFCILNVSFKKSINMNSLVYYVGRCINLLVAGIKHPSIF